MQTVKSASPVAPGLGSFGAVILAAGRSRRMGRPKLLLPWGAGTVLEHLVNTWRNLGAAQIVVVRAADDEALATELRRLSIAPANQVLNPRPEDGMFSSIRRAAGWQGWPSGVTHIALVLGDQPHVKVPTLRSFLAQAAAAHGEVFQPEHDGRRYHPVLFRRETFALLAGHPGPTLKDFLQTREVRGCPVDDAGLELDLDTPEDYERARRTGGMSW